MQIDTRRSSIEWLAHLTFANQLAGSCLTIPAISAQKGISSSITTSSEVIIKMKTEKGFSLLEVMVAIGLIGIIVVLLLSSLGIASKTGSGTNRLETARDLAQAQMEYVQNQTYDSINNPPVYTVLPNLSTSYPGFSIVTPMAARLDPKGVGTSVDQGIQQITVEVQQGGSTVFTLVGQKVRW
jgi:prepilin-type N-terminal cleavage/methylation domain-containing protein